MSTNSIVYVSFPKTGLGNMLLVWARALIFARLNQFELVTSSWWGFRWGALIRREQKKRLYWKYFEEAPLTRLVFAKMKLKLKEVVLEPLVEKLDPDLHNKGRVYLFNKVMTNYDLFSSLRDHHQVIRDELYTSLHPSKKRSLNKYPKPVIGVHIRRGDFKLGSTLTSLAYFIEGIKIIRSQVGQVWPVTVFTDATNDEIAELLSLPAITRAEEKADILDIILLSKSKVLLLSAGSTFSYWGAFLSEGFVIRPDNDWLGTIRVPSIQNKGYFEMKWQHEDEISTRLLKENICSWNIK